MVTDLALRYKPINRVINNFIIKKLINYNISASKGPFKIKKLDFINIVTNLIN